MYNRGQLFIGIVLILAGLAFLIGNLFDVDVWALCWPLGLILLGVWLLVRPQLVSPGTTVRQRLLGDIRRDGVWQVTDEEIWIGLGDVELDATRADVPVGETTIRILGFIGDVDVFVPQGVGISVSSTAFVTDARVLGQKREGFLFPVRLTSDSYETAKRKVRLETTFFITDLRVKQL